ncbi:MAG: hypothetical protein JW923_08600 [Spirochaetales bacterium]|nr:hypothetical protein [Spirochaetales bacterium]
MSDSNNPYQSPKAEASTVASMADSGAITGRMKDSISATAPWMRFLGIVGFVGAGIIALFGLFMMFGMMGSFAGMGALGAYGFVGGLIYIGIAVVAFFPARYMFRAGTGFRSYVLSQRSETLEGALANNKSFWKFTGIITIIYLALIPVMIIVTAAATASAMRGYGY